MQKIENPLSINNLDDLGKHHKSLSYKGFLQFYQKCV